MQFCEWNLSRTIKFFNYNNQKLPPVFIWCLPPLLGLSFDKQKSQHFTLYFELFWFWCCFNPVTCSVRSVFFCFYPCLFFLFPRLMRDMEWPFGRLCPRLNDTGPQKRMSLRHCLEKICLWWVREFIRRA